MTIRIILADDHAILRQGLRAFLAQESDFAVVAEAGSGSEAILLVEQHRPDVIVLDVMMPGINGLEVSRHLHEHFPGVRSVILSMHTTEAYVLEAFKNGAAAYVVKDTQAADLIPAIREVMRGKRFLSPPLTERAIQAYAEKTNQSTDVIDTLTAREREVFNLAARELTSLEIAGRLSIHPHNVDVYLANSMRKLNLNTRSELVRLAKEKGLLE